MTSRAILRDLAKLNSDVIVVFHHLNLFKELNKIINNNEELRKMDSTLLDWMRVAFTNDLVIGIGRICDKDRRTRSLVRLLDNLKGSPTLLTRKRYVRLHKSMVSKEIINKSFDRMAGNGKSSFLLSKIEKDIKILTKQGPCYRIICYRDQYIAHNDRRKKRSAPKYQELFEAFQIIESLLKKYNLLLRATAMITLTPTPQGDWQKSLTIPWI